MGNCNCDSNLKQNDQEILIAGIPKKTGNKKHGNNSYSHNPSSRSQSNFQGSIDYSRNGENFEDRAHTFESFQKISSLSSRSSRVIHNPLVKNTIGKLTRTELPEIQIEQIGLYKGQWKNGKRDGFGVFKWYDGKLY